MEMFDRFLKETGELLTRHGYQPRVGSLADQELATCPATDLIRSAYSQADLLTEAASEHFVTFMRTTNEPALALAPWACVRALIESSALAIWLLDPKIDARERVKRSFALRYEGLDQQAKLARSDDDQSALNVILKRIDAVERKALSFGFDRVLSKTGQRIGIGQVMPKVTVLVGQTLGNENTYRLLSAVTHAHFWALQQVGYMRVEAEVEVPPGVVPLKKSAKAVCFKYLSCEAVEAFSMVVGYKTKLFGWDNENVEERMQYYRTEVGRLAERLDIAKD